MGTCPQFIASTVESYAVQVNGALWEATVHTCEYFNNNLSDQFFEELAIAPHPYELDIYGGRHGSMTGVHVC